MKKNKVRGASWYKENFKKYRFGFLVFNILIISIAFLIFTSILSIVVGQRFFYDVQTQILELNSYIDKTSYNQVIHETESNDPRISVAYYYTDPKNSSVDQFINPEIIGSRVIGILNEEDVTLVNDITSEDTNSFELVEIKNHVYMTFLSKKWYKALDYEMGSDVIVCYVKIYMNVDGEMAARKEMNVSLVIGIISLMVLGVVVGYLITQRATSPLQEFVEKQITFVGDASHELRTPLAIVQSKLENILTNPNQKVYEVGEDLAISLKELSRLNKLTTDLLSLARSDQNKLTYHMSKENLNVVLNEIIEPFIEIASFEDRVLTYEGEDVDVIIDKDKVRELMIILLDNALKYTNEGDLIKVSLKNGLFDAIIEVSDTGIGISDETKEKIFERFYREDKARSRGTGGNGLGLSIAKTIVTDLSGKISVDHNEQKGTKFLITLPKAKKNVENI